MHQSGVTAYWDCDGPVSSLGLWWPQQVSWQALLTTWGLSPYLQLDSLRLALKLCACDTTLEWHFSLQSWVKEFSFLFSAFQGLLQGSRKVTCGDGTTHRSIAVWGHIYSSAYTSLPHRHTPLVAVGVSTSFKTSEHGAVDVKWQFVVLLDSTYFFPQHFIPDGSSIALLCNRGFNWSFLLVIKTHVLREVLFWCSHKIFPLSLSLPGKASFPTAMPSTAVRYNFVSYRSTRWTGLYNTHSVYDQCVCKELSAFCKNLFWHYTRAWSGPLS